MRYILEHKTHGMETWSVIVASESADKIQGLLDDRESCPAEHFRVWLAERWVDVLPRPRATGVQFFVGKP